MSSNVLLQRLEGMQQAIMAQHLGGAALPNATKGNEREVFLREYLQKLFPAHNRFSSGVIIDSHNNMSGQIDIAIEHPFAPSFSMPGSEDRLLLAESVAAVIEVKSDISTQWEQACNTAEKTERLRRRYGTSITFGSTPIERMPLIAVGYKGFKSEAAMKARLEKTPLNKRPSAVLTIESGVFTGGGISACGAWGLYALCVCLNTYMRGLQGASVDLLSYAKL